MATFQVLKSKSFDRDFKNYWYMPKIVALLKDAIAKLKEGKRLPKQHFLKGKMKGLLECHLKDDLLLLWSVNGTMIKLEHIGTHHQIFGR